MTADGRAEVTLDEMEETPAGPGLKDVKVDGDGVPDHLKGKSGEELLTHLKGVEEALKISERAREDYRAQIQNLPPRGDAVPPRPEGANTGDALDEPKEYTAEELAEMMKEKPAEALKIVQEQTTRRVTKQFEQRIAPLTSSGASGAQQRARERHPEAFKHLEKEIMASAAKAPDKSILNNDDIWDDVVAHAVGKNYKKFEEAKAAASRVQQESDALEAAAEGTPTTLSGRTQRVPATRGAALDEDQKRVAAAMNMTEAEYKRWMMS